MLKLTKASLALLLINGCASTVEYSSFPDSDDCNLLFKVVEVSNPQYDKLPISCLNESTLNGSDRHIVLQFNKELYRLIVDPEFPTKKFDRDVAKSLADKIDELRTGKKFELNCQDYRMFTNTPNDHDGIYFERIN